MTFGFSRDDTAPIIKFYKKADIYSEDPFAIIDEEGIGKLILMAERNGREVNPKLEIGLCGEQGGNSKSVKFLHKAGLDYVSVSPYRVLPAWLAAAQAAIAEKQSAVTPMVSLTMPKAEPSALIVSQGFFDNTLAPREALAYVAAKFPQMTVAFYGQAARRLGIFVDGGNVLAGDTLQDVISQLSVKGIKSANIILLNSSTEKLDSGIIENVNKQGIKRISFPGNTAAAVAIGLAVEKILGVDNNVSGEFLKAMAKTGVSGVQEENLGNILAKLEETTSSLPDDIAVLQKTEAIEKANKQVGNFLTKIGV